MAGSNKYAIAGAALTALLCCGGGADALVITQTTNGTNLLNALVPNQAQFSSISASYTTGAAAQAGTYTGFTSPPVTIGNGIVLSSGNAVDTPGPASSSNIPAPVRAAGQHRKLMRTPQVRSPIGTLRSTPPW